MRGLLEKVDLQGITVTLDAGNTSCETMQALQQHGADTLVTLKGNTGSAYDRLAQDGPWAGPEVRRTAKRWMRGQGRWERRELVTRAPVPEDWPPSPGMRQVFRVTHRTKQTEQVSAQRLPQFTGGTGRSRTGTISRGTCRWTKTAAASGPSTGRRTTRR